jgi:hypothetical protein
MVGAARSHVGPRVTHVLGIVVINLRGALGNTLYWVLLLGLSGATGNTLLGIGLCVSGNTLLGIAVGLCEASGNTLYWVLLLAMLHLGQHTLLAIVVGYAKFWATHFSGHH